MSRRHLPNKYPDYSLENASRFLNGTKFEENLSKKSQELSLQLLKDINNNLDTLTGKDYSVYTGYVGIALLYFLIAQKNNSGEEMKKAISLCEKAIKEPPRRASYLNGNAGPLALGAVIYQSNGEKEKALELVSRLLYLDDLALSESATPDEILYGRAGYLYSLLFVSSCIKHSQIEEEIRKVVEKIISSGLNLSKKRRIPAPLVYEWHDKNYLGAAHGVAGILYMLLCAKEYLTETELTSLVRPTLDWLLTCRYPGGNFLSSVGSDTDRLVQWCHGAPGFAHLYTLASKVYNEPSYMDAALKCGDVVWERGLLEKGYSICHGVSGNAYTFLHLYKVTKDPIHLYRAACFVDYCTKYPRNQGLVPDRPFSMFEGKAGLAYFLIDSEDPLNARFPGYEL